MNLLLTEGEAAEQLSLGRTALRRLVDEGSITPVRIGKRNLRFAAKEIERYVADLQGKPPSLSDKDRDAVGVIFDIVAELESNYRGFFEEKILALVETSVDGYQDAKATVDRLISHVPPEGSSP